MKRKDLFFGGILVIAIVLITVIFYGYQIFQTPNFRAGKTDKYLFIPQSTDFQGLIKILKRDTLIEDITSFAFLSKMMRYQDHVKPGRYLIKKNMNNLATIRMLRAGLQAPVRLTFNNIRLLDDFAERVGNEMAFGKDTLLKLLKNPQFTQKYGLDTTNILSLFIPNTYEFYWSTTPQAFVDKMHKSYQKFWSQDRLAKAKALNLTPAQVSVLASIVQAETLKNDEKPRVAGAYLNRLRKNMKLDADPTVIFAWRDFGMKRVLERHLKIDSPFNTYKYLGLPPGPINMPDTKSLDAVLNYEKHDYIFFCAKEDFSGYHNFAITYAEHLKNARLYQKALDMRGVK
ncbi:MAG: endolytic transglycosylase MltG [Microscillaceae bacterium]|jgi:UPF0755 protein|nr:endolytic transglycosylase MltG [Microscillaceae bacterium]